MWRLVPAGWMRLQLVYPHHVTVSCQVSSGSAPPRGTGADSPHTCTVLLIRTPTSRCHISTPTFSEAASSSYPLNMCKPPWLESLCAVDHGLYCANETTPSGRIVAGPIRDRRSTNPLSGPEQGVIAARVRRSRRVDRHW